MILVGGENLIDFIESPDGRFTANPGGGPYNIAKTLARQEQAVGYLTPISTDQMGDRLTLGLEASGATLLAPRSNSPTSLALVTLRNGQPSYQFYRQKTAERMVSPALLARITPQAATALHIGSLALTSGKDAEIWAEFYRASHARGLFTSLDPNIRPAFIKNHQKYLARIERLLSKTDLLKLSDEDLAWISPNLPIESAAKALRMQHGIPLLVLTKGSDGAMAFHQNGTINIPAAMADPFVDAVGAGDTFMGTLLAQLSDNGLLSSHALQTASAGALQTCLQYAAKAAALNCERSGCNPPNKAELIGGP